MALPIAVKKVKIPRKRYEKNIRSYIIGIILVVAAAGTYGYFQFTELATARAALEDGQTRLQELTALDLNLSRQYADLAQSFDTEFEPLLGAIANVLPETESYTKLTQELDALVLDFDEIRPSIFMSNLKFSQPRLETDKGYAVLPFTMTLETTRTNFDKMLRYVENSGSLNTASRLLDIRSISINFPSQQAASSVAASENVLTVSLTVHTYFQLPTSSSTKAA